MGQFITADSAVPENGPGYFGRLSMLLSSPTLLFATVRSEKGLGPAFRFLLFSTLFFMGASMTVVADNQALVAAILLANALGMAFVTALVAWMVTTMVAGRQRFVQVFSVVAHASGVTMLASWIPLFVFITEPWKWILVTLGLKAALGLTWTRAIAVSVGTIVCVVVLFCSLFPVVSQLVGG